MNNTPCVLHLVSDSTGETVSNVARAALAQFDVIDAEEHTWSLVRTKSQMDKVIASIEARPGAVLYTLVNRELRETLKAACLKMEVPCIPVLAPIIAELSTYYQLSVSAAPGRQHELNDEYFSRVEAINFTLAHDDGQSSWDLDEADIVIVGVSRTSKSPTSVYLAHRGYKAANVPYVPGCDLPKELFQLKKPLVVALTVASDRLAAIRKTRLQSINEGRDTSYADIEVIEAELAEAKKLFKQQHWPVIDVTRRSVEETAATIIQYFQKRYEQRNSTFPPPQAGEGKGGGGAVDSPLPTSPRLRGEG